MFHNQSFLFIKVKITYFVFKNFFPILAIYDLTWKNMVDPDRS